MGLFSGKKGLVLGVANDFSIAWAISQKLLAEGAVVRMWDPIADASALLPGARQCDPATNPTPDPRR